LPSCRERESLAQSTFNRRDRRERSGTRSYRCRPEREARLRRLKVIARIVLVGGASAWWAPRLSSPALAGSPGAQWSIVGVRQAPSTWKTFTSTVWDVALDYPPGWTVDDDGDEVTFRSSDGTTIVLGRTGTDAPSEPAPGRRTPKPACTTSTTSHDVVATVCVDPTSLVRRAVLVLKTRDGRQFRLALRTRGRDSQIFDAMLASVRRYP